MAFQDKLVTQIEFLVDRRQLNQALRDVQELVRPRTVDLSVQVRNNQEVTRLQQDIHRLSSEGIKLHVDTREIAQARRLAETFNSEMQSLLGNLKGFAAVNIAGGLVTQFSQVSNAVDQSIHRMNLFQESLRKAIAFSHNDPEIEALQAKLPSTHAGAPRQAVQAKIDRLNAANQADVQYYRDQAARAEEANRLQRQQLDAQAASLRVGLTQEGTPGTAGYASPLNSANRAAAAQRLAQQRNGGFLPTDDEVRPLFNNLGNEVLREERARRAQQRHFGKLTDFSGELEVEEVETKAARIRAEVKTLTARAKDAQDRALTELEVSYRRQIDAFTEALAEELGPATARAAKRQARLGTPQQRLASLEKATLGLSSEELKHFEREALPRLAQQYGVPLASAQENISKPSFFDFRRLQNNESLVQLGFAGAFGGIPSLVGGAIGGATPLGPSGALLGSTAAQAIREILLDKPLEAVNHLREQFQEAGLGFQRSILGITSILQANNQVVTTSGPINDPATALNFQQQEAKRIQLAARSQLLPLGIAGQTEATFVQGITSALSQRGVSASAEQIANISRLLGGAIQSQRPSLLDNTQQLLKDIQDVIGGGPAASRTVLSQLIRPSLGGLARAGSAADIEGALKPLEAFAQAAQGLDNPVVVINKLNGALDKLKTLGGEKLLEGLSPAFERMFKVLDDPKVADAAVKLGIAIGDLSGVGIRVGAKVIELASNFTSLIDPLSKIGPAVVGLVTGLAALEVAFIGLKRTSLAVSAFQLAKTELFDSGLLTNLLKTELPFAKTVTGGFAPNAQGALVQTPGTLGTTVGGVLGATGTGAIAGAIVAAGLTLLAEFKNQETSTREAVDKEQTLKTLAAIVEARNITSPEAQVRSTFKKLGIDEKFNDFQGEFTKSPEGQILALTQQRTALDSLATASPEGKTKVESLFRDQTIPFISKSIADETQKRIDEQASGRFLRAGGGTSEEINELEFRRSKQPELLEARKKAVADSLKSLELAISPEEIKRQKDQLEQQKKDAEKKLVETTNAERLAKSENKETQAKINLEREQSKKDGLALGAEGLPRAASQIPGVLVTQFSNLFENIFQKGTNKIDFTTAFEDTGEVDRAKRSKDAQAKQQEAIAASRIAAKEFADISVELKKVGKEPTNEIRNLSEQILLRQQERLKSVEQGLVYTQQETEAIKKRADFQLSVLDQTSVAGKRVGLEGGAESFASRRKLLDVQLQEATAARDDAKKLKDAVSGLAKGAGTPELAKFVNEKIIPNLNSAQALLDTTTENFQKFEKENFARQLQGAKIGGDFFREKGQFLDQTSLGGKTTGANLGQAAIVVDRAGLEALRKQKEEELGKISPDSNLAKQINTEILAVSKQLNELKKSQLENERAISDLISQRLKVEQESVSGASSFGQNIQAKLSVESAREQLSARARDVNDPNLDADGKKAAQTERAKALRTLLEAQSNARGDEERKIRERLIGIDTGNLGGRGTATRIEFQATAERFRQNTGDLAEKENLLRLAKERGIDAKAIQTIEADIHRLQVERLGIVRKGLEIERSISETIAQRLKIEQESVSGGSAGGQAIQATLGVEEARVRLHQAALDTRNPDLDEEGKRASQAERAKALRVLLEAQSNERRNEERRILEQGRSLDTGSLGGRLRAQDIAGAAFNERTSQNTEDLAAKRQLLKDATDRRADAYVIRTIEADILRLQAERKDLVKQGLELERQNLELIRAKLKAVLDTIDQRGDFGKDRATSATIDSLKQIDARLKNSEENAKSPEEKEDFERQRRANEVQLRAQIEARDIFNPAQKIRDRAAEVDLTKFGAGTQTADFNRQANNEELARNSQRINALQGAVDTGTASLQDQDELSALKKIQLKQKQTQGTQAVEGINTRVGDINEAIGAKNFDNHLEKSALDLAQKFDQLSASVVDSTNTLKDFAAESRLRSLGAQGQRIAAAEKYLKAGGSEANLDAGTLDLIKNPDSRRRFEEDSALEELRSVERKTDPFRLREQDENKRKELTNNKDQAEFALNKGFPEEQETTDVENARKTIEQYTKFRGSRFGDLYKKQAEVALRKLKGNSANLSNLTGKDVGFGDEYGNDDFGDLEEYLKTGKKKSERDREQAAAGPQEVVGTGGGPRGGGGGGYGDRGTGNAGGLDDKTKKYLEGYKATLENDAFRSLAEGGQNPETVKLNAEKLDIANKEKALLGPQGNTLYGKEYERQELQKRRAEIDKKLPTISGSKVAEADTAAAAEIDKILKGEKPSEEFLKTLPQGIQDKVKEASKGGTPETAGKKEEVLTKEEQAKKDEAAKTEGGKKEEEGKKTAEAGPAKTSEQLLAEVIAKLDTIANNTSEKMLTSDFKTALDQSFT